MVSPQEGLPKYGASATFSIIGIILAAFLGWWYSRVQRQSHQYEVITGKAYQPKIVKLGNRAVLAWLFIGLYLVLSKLIPLSMLLWASLLRYFEMPSVEAFARTSLQNYVGLPWELVLRGAGNTSILMILTPTITVIVSLIFAWVVLRSQLRCRFVFDFFAFLPHAVPNIIFAIGAVLLALFVLRGFIPLYGTIWLLLLLYIIVRLSYGTRMMNSFADPNSSRARRSRLRRRRQHLERRAANFGSDPHAADPLRLAVDRLTDLPRTDSRRPALARRKHDAAGGYLEHLAERRFRPGRGIDDGDAVHSRADHRPLLVCRPPIRHRPEGHVRFNFTKITKQKPDLTFELFDVPL